MDYQTEKRQTEWGMLNLFLDHTFHSDSVGEILLSRGDSLESESPTTGRLDSVLEFLWIGRQASSSMSQANSRTPRTHKTTDYYTANTVSSRQCARRKQFIAPSASLAVLTQCRMLLQYPKGVHALAFSTSRHLHIPGLRKCTPHQVMYGCSEKSTIHFLSYYTDACLPFSADIFFLPMELQKLFIELRTSQNPHTVRVGESAQQGLC